MTHRGWQSCPKWRHNYAGKAAATPRRATRPAQTPKSLGLLFTGLHGFPLSRVGVTVDPPWFAVHLTGEQKAPFCSNVFRIFSNRELVTFSVKMARISLIPLRLGNRRLAPKRRVCQLGRGSKERDPGMPPLFAASGQSKAKQQSAGTSHPADPTPAPAVDRFQPITRTNMKMLSKLQFHVHERGPMDVRPD